MPIDWHSMPALTALRAFEATARLQGFSAAARALNVTPAAVAQQVRGLEDHLGTALVQRDGRGLALTNAGERLALALGEAFGTLQSAVAAARAGRADGPVRITLTTGFATQWLMPRLRNFWATHPDIALSLHPDPRVLDLRREGMDVAIRYGDGQWPGVQARLLASARLVVAAAPGLLAGAANPDLGTLPWVLTQDWPEQENWMRSIGIDTAGCLMTEFPNEELALAAARQGLGVIVESLALLEDDLKTGRLVLVQDNQDALPGYFIITQAGPQRPAVRRFLAWLAAQA
jgi:LysR family glycine cleavage system transcriptional activator